MRGRVLAAALATVLVTGAGAGCGGERIEECDALLATIKRAAACNRLEPPQRSGVEQAARMIGDAIDRLEAVGPDRTPPELLSEARRTCQKQDAEIRQMYEKAAPECLR
jgi:hypothetical protein